MPGRQQPRACTARLHQVSAPPGRGVVRACTCRSPREAQQQRSARRLSTSSLRSSASPCTRVASRSGRPSRVPHLRGEAPSRPSGPLARPRGPARRQWVVARLGHSVDIPGPASASSPVRPQPSRSTRALPNLAAVLTSMVGCQTPINNSDALAPAGCCRLVSPIAPVPTGPASWMQVRGAASTRSGKTISVAGRGLDCLRSEYGTRTVRIGLNAANSREEFAHSVPRNDDLPAQRCARGRLV